MSEYDPGVVSPCVSVCVIDKNTGLCMGCLRTIREIGAWRVMTNDEKRATVALCNERAKTVAPRDRDGTPLERP